MLFSIHFTNGCCTLYIIYIYTHTHTAAAFQLSAEHIKTTTQTQDPIKTLKLARRDNICHPGATASLTAVLQTTMSLSVVVFFVW